MIIVLESLQSTTDPVEVDEKLPSEFHLETYNELLKSETHNDAKSRTT